MDAPKVKKIHPKIGTRMKMSRLQAKAPKKRHTFWKKWKQFLLVIGGTATTNIVVKVTKGAFVLPKRMFCVSSVFFFLYFFLGAETFDFSRK